MKELISIIVPIYNVEAYLDNCLNSIIKQTYDNLEIILVDDGSPDRCGHICDEYAKHDSRIKVIHKINGGLSDARNCGLRSATGKYVTCIDSDDYVSLDFIDYLYNLIIKKEADISICGFIKTPNMHEFFQGNEAIEKVYDADSAFATMLYARDFTTSAWGKLYIRELFKDIEYPVGKYSEDMFTTYRLILKSSTIVYGDKICYYYLHRPNSILTSTFSYKHLDVFEALHIMRGKGVLKTPQVEAAYRAQIVSSMAELLEKQPNFTQDIKELWNEAKRYRFSVLKNNNAGKRVRAQALLMLFGYHISTKVIVSYYSLKWRGKND